MRVFLSYARNDDEPFVKRLADALGAAAVDVWFDRRSMPSRSLTFLDEIRRAIDGVDRLVAVMGPAAIASDYVRCEWQYALIRDKPVVPILRLGGYDLPPELRNLHCPDVRVSRPWRDALAEILRVLNEPRPALGDAIGLPSLPPHLRPRPAALSRLAATVLLDQQKPANPERWQRVTVLSGMGGTGKSVLAAALARSVETRRAFGDGIYWLDKRRVPGPEAGLEALAQLVALHSGSAALLGTAEQRLTDLLRGKRSLFVLDNVERVEQLESIVRCVDVTGRVLVTTRRHDLVGGVHHVPLSGLERSEANQQLADWLQIPPHAFDSDCETILRICDGLPFAIALCGSLIASGVSRSAVAAKLRSMDILALQQRFPDYEYPGLLPCLEVSFEAVERAHVQAAACLERMVVFPAGALIPEATVFLLWEKSLGMDKATCSFELARLCSHSFVRPEREQSTVSIHQLIHTYLAQRVPDQRLIHEHLLSAYARISSSDWVQGPDDGYYHSHLVYHLLAARGVEPVCDLLVGSPGWMRAKLKIEGSALSYLVDLELALDAIDDSNADVLPLARLAAARHLSRKGPRSFGVGVLKAMVRLGLAENALELARANVDPLTRIRQLLQVYETLREKGDDRTDLLEEVESFLTRSSGAVSVEDVCSKLISLYARAGRLDDALRLWSALSEDVRNATEWLRVLLARRLAAEGRVDDARSLDPELPLLAIGSANTVDFNAAEREAMETRHDLRRDGALLQLVSVLSAQGQLQRAHAAAQAIGRAKYRMIALVGIPWEPSLQEALDIARTLDAGPRALGLMQVAEMLSRRHEFTPRASLGDRLRRWIRRWSPAGLQVTPAELMSEAEHGIETLEPLERATSLRLMALLGRRCAIGESRRFLEAARKSANEIDTPLRKAEELAEIAADLARLDGEPETIGAGRALLDEAMTLAEASSDPHASAWARAAVAGVLASKNRFELALTLVEQIPDESERRAALDRIAVACADAAQPARVEIIVQRFPGNGKAANQLAVALARSGRYDDALEAAAELHDDETWIQIARVLAEDGHPRRALQLIDQLTEQQNTAYQRVGVLADIARSDADRATIQNALERAQTTAEAIRSTTYKAMYQRVAVLADIARSDADPATTQNALERGRTTAEAIRSTTYKAIAFAELARAEAARDETAAGIRFERAVQLANAKDDALIWMPLGPSARFSALKSIGDQMTAAGFSDQALAVVSSIENETDDQWQALRASLIATVAAHGVRTGTLDQKRADELFSDAFACARRARNSLTGPWQAEALLQVASHLAKAGRLRSAFEAISQAHFTVEAFVFGITMWADSLEARANGLSLSVIAAIAEVFGWQRPDWKAIAEQISTSGAPVQV
jgi:pentatricopeptide repeat protein